MHEPTTSDRIDIDDNGEPHRINISGINDPFEDYTITCIKCIDNT